MSNEAKEKKQVCQLLSAKELAGILSTSVRTVWRLRSADKLPRPVTIGGSVRWVESTIAKWLEAGAPDRKTFQTIQEVER